MTYLYVGQKKNTAFTLIELLVVIAIIAILAAILFPVFASAREKARSIACLSNQSQIGLALMMYVDDYDERYPQEHPTDSNPVQDDAQGQLETIDYGSPFQKILPYVASGASPQIYVCPDDPDPHGAEILNAKGACLNGAGVPPGQLESYLLNAYFLFGATEAQIPEPSETIYIAERRSTGDVKTDFCDVHFHPWLGEIQAPTSSADTKDPIAIDSRRHSGGSNYVFADGHAKWQRFSLARQPFADHELYGEFQAF